MGLKDYFNEGDTTGYGIIDATYWHDQTWIATGTYRITSIKVKIYRGGNPGTVTVSIRNADQTWHKPTGSDLASGTTNGDTLTTDTAGEWREITLDTPYTVVSGTEYAIVLRAAGTNPNVIYWRGIGSNGYATGWFSTSSNSGVTWANGGTSRDYMFELYGLRMGGLDKTFSRSLVAIGNNELWYESSAGTMAEFTDANNDIDCSALLMATPAFGKLFIANDTNKKVADFINIKLTHATLSATNPPDVGTVLTGSGSGATMIVDYITSLISTGSIYGKLTSSFSFLSTDTVTGTDDDGNAISFTLTAPQDDGPHWYDWTVYGNDSSFGVMPTYATLICAYRGRLVLAGNKDYPHQWYMSKLANPFDWLYGTDDPMSAVAGNNADAGQCHDCY